MRGLHAGIVRPDAGVDHALQSGVGHRAVAAQSAVGRFSGWAFAAGRGRVVETAVGVLRREGQRVVGALQILAAGDEDQGLLHGLVVGPGARGFQGIDEELRVRQIRPLMLAVAGAAVGGVRLVLPLRLGPLIVLEKLLGILNDLVVASVAIRFGKTHQGQRRFVVAVPCSSSARPRRRAARSPPDTSGSWPPADRPARGRCEGSRWRPRPSRPARRGPSRSRRAPAPCSAGNRSPDPPTSRRRRRRQARPARPPQEPFPSTARTSNPTHTRDRRAIFSLLHIDGAQASRQLLSASGTPVRDSTVLCNVYDTTASISFSSMMRRSSPFTSTSAPA